MEKMNFIYLSGKHHLNDGKHDLKCILSHRESTIRFTQTTKSCSPMLSVMSVHPTGEADFWLIRNRDSFMPEESCSWDETFCLWLSEGLSRPRLPGQHQDLACLWGAPRGPSSTRCAACKATGS